MKLMVLGALVAALVIGIAGCGSDEQAGMEKSSSAEMQEQKPAIGEAVMLTMEATVAAINHDTRDVTLKNADGETVEITVSEDVKNLPQVEVGDIVTVEYMEAVSVEVMGAEGMEPGAAAAAAMGTAEPGERPAGAEVQELVVIAVIEAIDKENEQVTLKGPEGNSKTVKVRDPANLEKVAVGDNVMITYTRALAINVTEK